MHFSNLPKIVLEIVLVLSMASMATTYYVDDVTGNDGAAGTSSGTAWKSLVNPSLKKFSPGDSILFKAGGSWSGELRNDGNAVGTVDKPIVFDKYGTGKKPLITNGGSGEGASPVTLRHNNYIEFNNFELTCPNGCTGIKLFSEWESAPCFATLKNLEVHNVKGSKPANESRYWGGIIWKNGGSAKSRIILKNCTVYDIKYNGIEITDFYKKPINYSNVFAQGSTIDGCTIYNCGGNGILFGYIMNGLITNCKVYNCATDNGVPFPTAAIQLETTLSTTIQECEIYNNRTYALACDIEALNYGISKFGGGPYPSQKCTFQYNYIHDNTGGVLTLETAAPSSPPTTQSKFCYNVCQNNGGILFRMGKAPANEIFNNTIYNSATTTASKVLGSAQPSSNTVLKNNIVYLSQAASYDAGGTWDYNCFFGSTANIPTDAHKITVDPLILNPGNAAVGRSTTGVYQLKPGSPCLDAGTAITNNGGKDFWGNPVPHNGKTNIGAYEGAGTTSTAARPSLSAKTPASSFAKVVSSPQGIIVTMLTNEPFKVSISALNGKCLIRRINQIRGSLTIPHDNLPVGMFVVTVFSMNSSQSQKVLVSR